jgi:hypothetical protein
MRLSFLSHLLKSVVALACPQRTIVLGSSSLLPQHPELGEAGQPLEVSLDADLLLEPVDQALADMLKDAITSKHPWASAKPSPPGATFICL